MKHFLWYVHISMARKEPLWMLPKHSQILKFQDSIYRPNHDSYKDFMVSSKFYQVCEAHTWDPPMSPRIDYNLYTRLVVFG